MESTLEEETKEPEPFEKEAENITEGISCLGQFRRNTGTLGHVETKNVDIVSMILLTLKPSPEEINKSFHSLPLRMKSQLLSSASRIYYTLVLCDP